MAALGKGALATALATAMAVMPSLVHAQGPVAAKPAPDAKLAQNDDKPLPFMEVVTYSEKHPVVAIGISKGSKDPISGQKIGETLSNVLNKAYQGAPSKYFVWEGGDYTSIIFAVKGHLYGPYGLKDSLVAIAVPADNYWSKVQRGIFPPPATASGAAAYLLNNLAAKPAPEQ